MRTFRQFIIESEIPFDKSTNHGFWEDSDYVDVYHGTHKKNVKVIEDGGLNRPDPKTGMISVTMDPYTAHGYAAMSGSGGEANFRQAGTKAVNTPHEDRAVMKFRLPSKWLQDNMDHDFGGNVGQSKKNLMDKNQYAKWKTENPTGSDHNYYALSEFRLKSPVPKEFYVGHSDKVKPNVD